MVNEEAAGVEQCQPYSYWSVSPSPDLRMRYDHVGAGHGSSRLPFIVHAHEKYCITPRIAPFQGFFLSGRRLAKHATSVGFWLFVPLTSFSFSFSSCLTDGLALLPES